jgi:epoxyqueuosine reductase QueG
MPGLNRSLNHELELELKRIATDNGIALFGIADIISVADSMHPEVQTALQELALGISLGIRLSNRIMQSLVDKPTKLYLHHYKTCNQVLDHASLKLTNIIQTYGYNAIPIPASQLVDWGGTTSGHISHRKIAQRAGHGWFGRSGLIVHPDYGARVRYASIFTDAPLPISKPYLSDCGECQLCIAACPAGAIAECGVDIKKCFEQLKQFAKHLGGTQYICGLCIKACPGERTEKPKNEKT